MISIEENLGVMSCLGKVKKLLTYGVKLDLLVVMYIQFVIMPIELTGKVRR
jgi:hypothetical protein